MALSEFAVRKAKPRAKPYKLFDGGGLFLHVQPSGSKLWRLKYRFNGKEKLLSYGPYPAVSIADARSKRDNTKRLLAAGSDPAVEKRLDKIAAQTAARQTFGLVADEYLEQLEANGAATATLAKKRWLLINLASSLAQRPVKEILPAEVLDLLKRVEVSGRHETARKLRGAMSAVFRLAIATLRADADPTVLLRGALQGVRSQGRAAITDERELGILMTALDDYTGWPTVVAALKFQILTCVRPGEVRGAQTYEIDFEKAAWHIPAERMKMRRPHSVPLSRQALQLLHDIAPYSDEDGLVFPSVRSKKKQLSENAFNVALRRMGYTKEEVTAHGFRVTASTILNAKGYDPDVIEAVLAHQDRNAIRRAYNRTSYWDQRVVLMQEWADLLNHMRSGQRRWRA